jgi:hypothetical protein
MQINRSLGTTYEKTVMIAVMIYHLLGVRYLRIGFFILFKKSGPE